MKTLAYHENRTRGKFNFPIEFHFVDSSHPRYFMPLHWHMEYELIYITKGTLNVIIDDKSYFLTSGDSALISEGCIHGYQPNDCIYESIVLDLMSFLSGNMLCKSRVENTFSASTTIKPVYPKGDDVNQILKQLFTTIKNEKESYELTVVGLLWQFVGSIIQNNLYTTNTQLQAQNSINRIKQIKKVLRRIRLDYDKPLSLSDLASETELSPKYFCIFFKQITGKTPINYLNFYRIECACEQLLATDNSITDIAYSCGFNDLSYFIKSFKKLKNITPKKFRDTSLDSYVK